MNRIKWISDNGKYQVLVRYLEGEVSPVCVGFWKMQSNGKFGPVRYKNLPQYVLDKARELKEKIVIGSECCQ